MSSVILTSASQIVPPVEPAISTEWARTHLKAVTYAEDRLIESWILAATAYFEEITGRQVMTATWEYWLDAFPVSGVIELPKPPLQSVIAVEHTDDAGDTIPFTTSGSPTLDGWLTQAPQGVHAPPGWIYLRSGLSWPTVTLATLGRVRVRYTAGYGTSEHQVPDLVKAAILMLAGSFEQFRSEQHLSERSSSVEELPFGAKQIMRGFRDTALPVHPLRTTWVA